MFPRTQSSWAGVQLQMSSSLKGSHYERTLALFSVCTKTWPHLNQSPISCSALSTASLPWQMLRPTWGVRVTYKLLTHGWHINCLHMHNNCQYLYTIVSSDCSRFAGCRVGLSKHYPEMSLLRFRFLVLNKPASLHSTLAFPCHCHNWARVHVGHLGSAISIWIIRVVPFLTHKSWEERSGCKIGIVLPEMSLARSHHPEQKFWSWRKSTNISNQPDSNQLEAFLLKSLHNLTNKSPLKRRNFAGVINWGLVNLDSIRLDHYEGSLSLSPCLSL